MSSANFNRRGGGHTLRANGRIVLLLLSESEASTVDEALRRFRPSSGGGQRRLVQNMREMIASSRYTEAEIRGFGEMAAPRKPEPPEWADRRVMG